MLRNYYEKAHTTIVPIKQRKKTRMRKDVRSTRHMQDITIINQEVILRQCVECDWFRRSKEHLLENDCKRFAE